MDNIQSNFENLRLNIRLFTSPIAEGWLRVVFLVTVWREKNGGNNNINPYHRLIASSAPCGEQEGEENENSIYVNGARHFGHDDRP
jgi:hypothetical protein